MIAAQSVIAERTGCYQLIYFGTGTDYNDSTKHILYFATVQPEMDKAFYAEADEQLKQIYLDYTAKRLSLINAGNTAAPEDIYDFGKKLSEKRLSPEEYYDVDKVNNLYFFEQIAKMFPDIDMESVLASSGLKKEQNPYQHPHQRRCMFGRICTPFYERKFECVKNKGKAGSSERLRRSPELWLYRSG